MSGAMSLKEKAVLATLAVVVLYAIAAACWFLNLDKKMGWCPKSWGDSIRRYERECKTYRDQRRLISERDAWVQAYEDEKSAMPTFGEGRFADTTWLSKMGEIARKHHVTITQRQAGKPVEAGDVMELEIDVRNWEGALESLVQFLYELESTSEGMFDVKSLNFRPSAKKGYLKGAFTLTCAYMSEG